ncbi:M56 family metallopeptidase [Streptomyces sp. H27-C3]|uniref:M56 family metallopeptidase n=1 Tax=Streptomyces sp. H27-C3 TaxID=3046305 RepID=UPI0024BBD6A2|nr:M56 family metallopeptidase [Streptomyces sp. H27-C3]MDJ0464106.1 M56 family metallopeptidase [Streptomyces sp. H27-C3]
MNAAPALIGYMATVGVVAPRLILRSSWPHRAPALAAVVWQALALSFAISAALTAYHLATPTEHLHTGLLGLLHACGLHANVARPDPGMAQQLAVALPGTVMLALIGSFALHVLRARSARARHRDALDLVGRHSEHLHATVLAYDAPAAYCLPGWRSRIVVSDAAVELLSSEQLDAVLEHERAHVAGRHHLVLAAAEAFASVFRWVPLARHIKEQTALLLEMIADDRALRTHSHAVFATAMYEMAAATTPRGAFAIGGHTALVRLRRVLGPRRAPHPVLRGAAAAAAVIAPVLPLLLACPPSLG